MPRTEASRCLAPALCAGASAALLALALAPAQRVQARPAAAALSPAHDHAREGEASAPAAESTSARPAPADARNAARTGAAADFDFETGLWRTHVRRLAEPLGAAQQWLEYTGTTRVVAVHGGRANLAELAVAGPAGRIDGVALRLYRPQSQRWSIHYASLRDGGLTAPLEGGFVDGRGEFFGDDSYAGRPIRVRFRIHCPQADRCLFEQAFSADGGRSWQTNWLAEDTRIASAAGAG